MKISELTSGQGNIDVEGTVTEMGELRTFNKFGKELSVANAKLTDESGSVKLSLWNEDATKFKDGDKVKITNGYVNEFQGEKQLTSGKFGKIEMADGASQEELPTEGTSEEAPTEMPSETPSEPTENSETVSEEPKEEVF
jgi:replication factor A1